MARYRPLLPLCLLTVWASTAAAQTAVLTGSVREDSSGRPLPDAEVVIEALGRRVFTDSAGRYLLGGIPPGVRLVIVRRIGYHASALLIQLGPNDTIRRDVTLETVAVELDPIEVTGRPDARRPRGIGFEAFDERRRLGLGRFVDSTALRQSEHLDLTTVLRRAGVEVRDNRILGRGGCTLSGYLDGVFIGAVDPRMFTVFSLAGVEVYRSVAQAPPEYVRVGMGCGLILLWTRMGP